MLFRYFKHVLFEKRNEKYMLQYFIINAPKTLAIECNSSSLNGKSISFLNMQLCAHKVTIHVEIQMRSNTRELFQIARVCVESLFL